MNSEWKSVFASEICAKHKNSMSTGPFGSAISSKFFVEKGIPVIRGSNLSQETGIRLNHNNLVFLTEEKATEFSRSIVKDGDLIFTCWGTIDQVGLIDENSDFDAYVISNKQMKMTPDLSLADSEFLYYQFSSPRIKKWILDNGIGSSVPGFNLGMLKSIELVLPPISEQKAIAHILSTLDKKIELNKRTNKTLEDIANALFKSWFIEFDPVKAKKEGLSTGLTKEINDLFPDSFEESEFGGIPSGWEYIDLEDLLIYANRGVAPTYTDDINYPVINQKCIRNKEIDFELCKFTEHKKNLEKHFLSQFDVLINSMGTGTLGRISLFINYSKKIVADGCITVLRGKNKNYSLYVYQNLSNREKEIINLSTGSTGQTSLNKKHLLKLKIIKPTNQVLEKYASIVEEIFIQKNQNWNQSCILELIRNLLLPKLIAGEIRIPEAEKFLEEVGI